MRPALNFCVALFIFLSGLLTTKEKAYDVKSFYKKRIGKVALPYLFWSAIYILLFGKMNAVEVLRNLLLGNAAGHLYYLIVYMSLVILAPLLFRALDIKPLRIALYCITPITLIAHALTQVFCQPMLPILSPFVGPFVGTWLIFYIFGLEWESHWSKVFSNTPCTIAGLLVAIAMSLQLAESFIWYSADYYPVAISQLKLSAMVTSLATCIFAIKVKSAYGCHPSERNVFVALGNYSFGIYLSHMVLVRFLKTIINVNTILEAIVLSAFTLLAAYVLIWICQRILPESICKLLGFGS